MKRLTDAEVRTYHGVLGEGRYLDAVLTDHLQAREDVKRLAAMLLGCATEAPDGTLCWCGDGEVNAYCWHKPGGRADFCVRRSALLSEVTP